MAMEATQERANVHPVPSDDHRQSGIACLFDVELSAAEYWVDGAHHVIQSAEFEVIASATSFDGVLARFCGDVVQYALYLGDLPDRAENEEEMFHVLAPRITRAFQRLEVIEEQQAHSRVTALRAALRRTRNTGRAWLPSSEQRGSQVPSLA